MHRLLYALILSLSALTASATVWDVEVGGGGFNGVPYYAPQNLVINQGDEVVWTWVSGAHNVTQTSGPVFFASGNKVAPDTWAFIFEVAGIYSYECTIEGHAFTQFGQITVNAVNSTDKIKAVTTDFQIFPNPASDRIQVDISGAGLYQLTVMDITGKAVRDSQIATPGRCTIEINELSPGIYFIELRGEIVQRKRLTVR